jgi:hypothetical protein
MDELIKEIDQLRYFFSEVNYLIKEDDIGFILSDIFNGLESVREEYMTI